jgi:UDP-N-acetylmuramoyl-L-alanyl-D-glutamate--2,6-diaminopimelate ligase
MSGVRSRSSELVPPRALSAILGEVGITLELARARAPGIDLEQLVTGVTEDSRKVLPGAVFVALDGTKARGLDFAPAAVAAGAALVVGEAASPPPLPVPYLHVLDARGFLASFAAAIHSHPSRRLKVIGITGTSGKTTCSYLVESVLREAGYRVGLMGTVAYRFGGRELAASHTTPGPVELQALLAQMLAEGCDSVVMEVSSHALAQGRVGSVAFDIGVFTNLSRDHLDFHRDMEDYFQSKKLLFTRHAADSVKQGKRFQAVVNAGDAYGERLARELPQEGFSPSEPVVFSREKGLLSPGPYAIPPFAIASDGIRGRIGGSTFVSPLVGAFNSENLLAAAAVGSAMGLAPEAVARGLESLRSVPGRLESVPNPLGIRVLVDYAHKPDALEKVLRTLDAVRGEGRLLLVFGCGGDRDRGKRPQMGRLAGGLSSFCVITSDNPRTEDPERILSEIVAGVPPSARFEVIVDREHAIMRAIEEAVPGDIVLIAGKGHETYQLVVDPNRPGEVIKLDFDDREVASRALIAKARS